MGTFILKKNEQMIAGIPIGKLNNIDKRLAVLESGHKVQVSNTDHAAGYLYDKLINAGNVTFGVFSVGDVVNGVSITDEWVYANVTSLAASVITSGTISPNRIGLTRSLMLMGG